jgi:hypothetical protein
MTAHEPILYRIYVWIAVGSISYVGSIDRPRKGGPVEWSHFAAEAALPTINDVYNFTTYTVRSHSDGI